ncbi:unnamed protein product [Nesidiocoris tenuis]|uniref:NR LBD domain-containing protein n=1 Tax=Nesidiocoris tenuis TaxID=355587 RepID=A0A6H5HIK3_9HEMI|nr:unnamed protein product [Nesidiocoris tenuis]
MDCRLRQNFPVDSVRPLLSMGSHVFVKVPLSYLRSKKLLTQLPNSKSQISGVGVEKKLEEDREEEKKKRLESETKKKQKSCGPGAEGPDPLQARTRPSTRAIRRRPVPSRRGTSCHPVLAFRAPSRLRFLATTATPRNMAALSTRAATAIAIREDRTRGGRSTYQCSYTVPAGLVEQKCAEFLQVQQSAPPANQVPQLLQIDDQTSLLIDAWCELLLFSCCFRSMSTPGEIRVSQGKCITLAEAKNLGLAQPIERMLNFTDHLRRLKVDKYEYVAMKVIVLLSSVDLKTADGTCLQSVLRKRFQVFRFWRQADAFFPAPATVRRVIAVGAIWRHRCGHTAWSETRVFRPISAAGDQFERHNSILVRDALKDNFCRNRRFFRAANSRPRQEHQVRSGRLTSRRLDSGTRTHVSRSDGSGGREGEEAFWRRHCEPALLDAMRLPQAAANSPTGPLARLLLLAGLTGFGPESCRAARREETF